MCGRLELRQGERSRRERDGHIHARSYCGPDRRVNRRREIPGFWASIRDGQIR